MLNPCVCLVFVGPLDRGREHEGPLLQAIDPATGIRHPTFRVDAEAVGFHPEVGWYSQTTQHRAQRPRSRVRMSTELSRVRSNFCLLQRSSAPNAHRESSHFAGLLRCTTGLMIAVVQAQFLFEVLFLTEAL